MFEEPSGIVELPSGPIPPLLREVMDVELEHVLQRLALGGFGSSQLDVGQRGPSSGWLAMLGGLPRTMLLARPRRSLIEINHPCRAGARR